MKLQKFVILLIALVILSAGFSTYSALAAESDSSSQITVLAVTASCGSGAPGWTCSTSVVRSGSTTTCTAKATSPGGSYNIYMYGAGPGGKALHTSSGAYYGSSSTKSCYASSCTIKFTYTGSALPTLCNWAFYYW